MTQSKTAASKTAAVTGATSGIGLATVNALLDVGYERVIAGGLSADELKLLPNDPRIEPAEINVRDQSQVDAFAARATDLGALVNAAGTILREGKEHTPEGFATIVDINLNGTQRVCHACKDALIKGQGAVVNIGSMFSIFGSPLTPGYAASKGGVMQLTKSLAVAWAKEGIRVNAVAPGWIETAMTAPMHGTERYNAITDRTPMGRWGGADEVADVVAFLLSEKARYVTGVLLPIDGGYSVA